MTNLTVEVPDRLAKELSDASQEFIAEMIELGLRTRKIEQALAQYARGKMTLGAAAHLAGVPESEMARHAYARGLEPRFSKKTLAEEVAL
jgi:predicted HTH domain antitoxin